MLTLVMVAVNWLFTLQEFDIDGVAYGWRIVRDLCNMFFILVLLIIAFATILRLENYSMKKYLPKLLIMAVLINFSKTICLFLIDISQVVMLTFSNAFAGASSNFVVMLHIDELLALSKAVDFGDMDSQMFYAAGLALIFMAIALFIMIMLMGILIMRLIMFWILIVLAPLAFLSTAVPGGGKYWTQWWGEFTKYLIVGPVLAFFTWLSLTIAKNAYDFLDLSSAENIQTTITEIGNSENAMQLILAIGLLIGAMKITMSIGAMGASFGANLASKAKMTGLGLGTKGLNLGKTGAKTLGFWASRQADTAQMKVQKNVLGVKKARSLNYRMIKEGWNRNRANEKSEYESGLSGVWQDRFHRASTMQDGPGSKVPIWATGRRIKARMNKKKIHEGMKEKEGMIDVKEKQMEKSTDNAEKQRLGSAISELKSSVTKDKQKIIELREKLPEDRQHDIEKRRATNKFHSEVREENKDEDELVAAYMMERNKDKKKAYLQHLADINGLNTLFATKGIEMDFKGKKKFFKDEFGDEAGQTAADISKRADAAGNSAFVGFSEMNVSTGKNELVKNQKTQINIALAKNKEKHDQAFSRKEHFDSLVDQNEKGERNVSVLGLKQMLDIGQSSGKTKEIEKGNYQERYAKTVVSMKEEQLTADAINKKLEEAGLERMSRSEISVIQETYKRFNSYYNPNEIAKRKEQEKNEKKQEKSKEEEKTETRAKREKLTNEEFVKKAKDFM